MVLKGKWQKGHYFRLSADEFKKAVAKASLGVMKPTAIEQKGNKWRVYYKPLQEGEMD